MAIETGFNNLRFCAHFVSGSVFSAQLMFLLNAFVTVFWLVGFKTRLFGFLTWFLTFSLQSRNPIVLHSGDVFLRCVLFFCMFLPLGEKYSVDSALLKWKNLKVGNHICQEKGSRKNLVCNAATFSLLAQVCMVYIFSALLKSGSPWTKDLTATQLALNSYYFKMPLANFLLKFPSLLKLMTFLVLKWEMFAPILFWIPFRTHFFRSFACVGFMFLHLGLALNLRLGLFFWSTFFLYVALFPAQFWDWMDLKMKSKHKKFTVFVDTTKTVSCWIILFFCGILLSETVEYSFSSSSDQKKNEIWMRIEDNNSIKYENMESLIVITGRSVFLYPLHFTLRMTPKCLLTIADSLVLWSNQILLGSCLQFCLGSIPPKKQGEQPKSKKNQQRRREGWDRCFRLSSQVFVSLLIFYVLLYNLNSMFPQVLLPFFPQFGTLAVLTGLDQHWGMFSPSPPPHNFWINMRGELVDDTVLELFSEEGIFKWRGTEFTGNPPNPFHKSFRNHRWWKYFGYLFLILFMLFF